MMVLPWWNTSFPILMHIIDRYKLAGWSSIRFSGYSKRSLQVVKRMLWSTRDPLCLVNDCFIHDDDDHCWDHSPFFGRQRTFQLWPTTCCSQGGLLFGPRKHQGGSCGTTRIRVSGRMNAITCWKVMKMIKNIAIRIGNPPFHASFSDFMIQILVSYTLMGMMSRLLA